MKFAGIFKISLKRLLDFSNLSKLTKSLVFKSEFINFLKLMDQEKDFVLMIKGSPVKNIQEIEIETLELSQILPDQKF